MDCIKNLLRDESGEDMIEYGLLAAFISIVALVTVRAVGFLLNDLWVFIRDTIAA